MPCPHDCQEPDEEELTPQDHYDRAFGVTRCVRCGTDLQGEVECPLCSMLDNPPTEEGHHLPAWIVMTAGFMTSPLSLYWVWRSRQLSLLQKLIATSGAGVWISFITLI